MELGTITLGAAPMTQEEKTFNFPFEANSFTDERIMLHKFAHELSHFLGEAIADEIDADNTNPNIRQYEALIGSFASFRAKGKGVTAHAGDPRYVQKGPDIQAVEDMTDLMAFYLVDPQYLDRYLQFLSDPQYKEQREKHQLMTLSQPAVEAISRNISQVVDQSIVY